MEERKENNEVYSKRVKAGKRTYFIDPVNKRPKDAEDLNKFIDALHGTAEHIKKELIPDYDFDQFEHDNAEKNDSNDLSDNGANLDTTVS